MGLRRFSVLLLEVALVLTTAIFVINLLLHRPLLDAALFSLAIAVGITPQLLPAVVSTGSRQLARRKVLVKRLVCIEDLGLMLHVFHAGPALFRSGWFVESLATQTLVIFAIRTRRIPFLRSRPSSPLLIAALAGVGVALPFSPLLHLLGFQPRPLGRIFFADPAGRLPSIRRRSTNHHLQRRASRFHYTGPRIRPAIARTTVDGLR